jgi:hypothetical protein
MISLRPILSLLSWYVEQQRERVRDSEEDTEQKRKKEMNPQEKKRKERTQKNQKEQEAKEKKLLSLSLSLPSTRWTMPFAPSSKFSLSLAGRLVLLSTRTLQPICSSP